LGDKVVIQGAGALGLYAIALAREMGATSVIVIDGLKERLRMAEEFGADYTLDLSEFESTDSRVEEIMNLTGGFGADLCIEVAGTPEAVPEGLQMLRRGGRYLEMGTIFKGAFTSIDISWLIMRALRIVGARNYEPRHLAKALDFLMKNRSKYPFKKLITKKYALAEINEAFKTALKRTELRVAVTP
ncbi:MAG: zinc-binding dehydrogenase, partial [Nitrososphaeria archaeon]|nr:zinc-binding dehydrogenase [Nitrososphaeria archaeon]